MRKILSCRGQIDVLSSDGPIYQPDWFIKHGHWDWHM